MFKTEKISFIGVNNEYTNFVATLLLEFAGNPHGTFMQAESCVYCGNNLLIPTDRSMAQKVAT
jgi:hypothetical protein